MGLIAAGIAAMVVMVFLRAGKPVVVERNLSLPGSPATADGIRLRDRAGFRAFNRGLRTRSETWFPRLPSTNAFWSAINQQVLGQSRQVMEEFTRQVTWSALAQALREPSAMNDWEMKARWEVEYLSPQLASLVAEHWEYTGGAHGNTGFGAMNTLPEDGTLREILLSEFFLPDTDWRDRLSARLTQLINRQKQETWGDEFSDDLAATVEAEEMQDAVYSITPEGFRFWFAPYEKGAFAEGSFRPLIPYGEIISLLDTNGPARWLPCFDRPP